MSAGVAAAAAFVVAIGSGINDLPNTWDWLSQQHAQFGGLSAADRAEEPGTAQLLPVDAFDFFRSKLRHGDRFYIAASNGRYETGVDRATASRIFGRFYLLPAQQVDSPARANVVFTVGVDPHTLGVPLEQVEKFSGGGYYAARVRS